MVSVKVADLNVFSNGFKSLWMLQDSSKTCHISVDFGYAVVACACLRWDMGLSQLVA